MISKFIKILAIFISSLTVLLLFFAAFAINSDMDFFRELRELYVETAMTTLNHQYLATMFIDKTEIDRIRQKNIIVPIEKTDASNISFDSETKMDIELIDITEKTYKGKLLIIHDPSRIKLAVSKNILKTGEKLSNLIASENAIGGINASGFRDPQGRGKGGLPIGIVIKDGQVVFKSRASSFDIIGFNYDNILVLGRYKRDEIASLNLRDAVSFSPFLIVNGQEQIKPGNGAYGLQPRTAIGQTKNGSVLFLVIDGRQVSSLGATLRTVQDILLKHGAYNAANLDGGSSTVMYYEGHMMNTPCSKYGERFLPTAFIIK
ncbi:MAG TPA: exopolysaccharide biosynthesis protein [Candidatus Margulisbacteria bacterium]|nr:MAG: hypothetical protein A2X43_04875 [Candidatus Margulisbacteria bacterium GWD2_39_127]OGI03625.1 MAG: hypothetical protein A2X42_01180 [Candidatus Margulisbacteria bacterium GWF2_38_17]HAR64362.1 exopolysaccharide biosynthesis protein [Candidatus Margulisiibacteriota bacterium]